MEPNPGDGVDRVGKVHRLAVLIKMKGKAEGKREKGRNGARKGEGY